MIEQLFGKKNDSPYTLRWHEKIAEIPQTAWDAMALPLATPFLEWEWLHNLETSGSVKPRTGWQPCHLTVWHHQTLVAAAPLYIKGHSYGEFVFDHQWADLAHRLGIQYYPKLLGMTPFTPAVGYRFLIAEDEDELKITEMMVNEIDHFCIKNNLSGCNFLFVDPQWQTVISQFGFTAWMHHSYIWSNKNFNNFDDYLKIFTSDQRKNIKRERKAVLKANLVTKNLVGDEIPHYLYPYIYKFYSNTCDKFYWGSKYLNKQFFEQLYPNYSHRLMLVVAHREDNDHIPVGMSFCIRKDENLYGRYWGSLAEYDCLHFEACYYKPIEWGIAEGIKMYDPGAGGSHKRRRGFPATANHSMHRFYNPRMSSILRHYIDEINQGSIEEIKAINDDLPFTKKEINLNV
ncbi:GNAT family N-acetyltransferase [Geminocystis sp. CENA526]|uniref:GNAT family N-acetyltransferase n=1 Tax=Geminocystis sp. CENA526 TaxID=1355871 RepID=UPI003D6F2BC2